MTFPKHVLLPKRLSLYDYIYVKKNYGSWNTWSSLIEPQTIPATVKPTEVFINTVETLRQTYFFEKLLKREYQVIHVGPTGTGKTSIINNFLFKLPRNKFIVNNLNFSARTTADQTQDIIMSKLMRLKKGVYGPSMDKKAIFFIDDLNMPLPEKYGAQPPIELLRNLADHGFLYERAENHEIFIQDTLIFGAMAPPGGGRNNLTSRFTRHFNVLSIESFDDDLMRAIFSPIINWHFNTSGFPVEYHKFAPMIIEATLKLYNKVIHLFLPTPSKSHYLFNLRDFSRVIQVKNIFLASLLYSKLFPAHKPLVFWNKISCVII